jgi:hypothetical protein
MPEESNGDFVVAIDSQCPPSPNSLILSSYFGFPNSCLSRYFCINILYMCIVTHFEAVIHLDLSSTESCWVACFSISRVKPLGSVTRKLGQIFFSFDLHKMATAQNLLM